MNELLDKYTYGLPPPEYRIKLQRRKAAEVEAAAELAAHSLSAAAEDAAAALAGGQEAGRQPVVVAAMAGSVTDEDLLAAAWEAEQALDRTQTTTAPAVPAATEPAAAAAAEAAEAPADEPENFSLSLRHVIGKPAALQGQMAS
jgi:hypothetical protein